MWAQVHLVNKNVFVIHKKMKKINRFKNNFYIVLRKMLSIKQILSVLLWSSLPHELHVLKKEPTRQW